ncbi:MAG TPA: hypothetical protein D7H97_01430 [Candidatus Poseidoniales archaeon]|jgi:hypothetical protein|nr:MAG TPA: hypothetical protein D7H97_01430 [Candidatus Poseidoniales archaeon]|tara:strand:+ start:1752 stop:1958 length:207 start_codon:yes stop_codon:yes gene_type:complete
MRTIRFLENKKLSSMKLDAFGVFVIYTTHIITASYIHKYIIMANLMKKGICVKITLKNVKNGPLEHNT